MSDLWDTAKAVLRGKFIELSTFKKAKISGASLVAQWLRVCLLVQGHGFEPWSGKFPHAAEQLGP